MTFFKNILALSVLSTLVACGSSSESNGTTASTGTFVDSPVINIGYKTDTLEGVTNDKGEYDYVEGESVTFFIGDLVLPATKAQGVVTPLDLVGTTDAQDVKVINMLRLLQTLDQDGDPSNGLTITEDAKSVATEVNLSLPIDEFAALPAVIELIENADLDTPVTELISAIQALAHFETSLINQGLVNKSLVGTWISTDAPEVELLTFSFFKDGTYLHHEVTNDEEWFSGMEWGNYEYNKETNKLTIGNVLFDGNKGSGLVGDENDLDVDKLSAAVDGDTLDLDITFLGGSSETLAFNRVVSQGIVGTWINPSTSSELLSFSFFDDGTYLHSEVNSEWPDAESGMEWGTYVRDVDTGKLTVTLVYDDNSVSGLSDLNGGQGYVSANVVDGMLELKVDELGDGNDIKVLNFYSQYVTIPPIYTEKRAGHP
jgi:hypothetical protein